MAKTEYVVLAIEKDEAAFLVKGRATTDGPERACREVAEAMLRADPKTTNETLARTVGEVEAMQFVAVPARSFQPMKVKIDTNPRASVQREIWRESGDES